MCPKSFKMRKKLFRSVDLFGINVELNWCAWIGPKLWQTSLQIRYRYYEVLVTYIRIQSGFSLFLSQMNVPFLKTLLHYFVSLQHHNLLYSVDHTYLLSVLVHLVNFLCQTLEFFWWFSTDIPACFVGNISVALSLCLMFVLVFSTHEDSYIYSCIISSLDPVKTFILHHYKQ